MDCLVSNVIWVSRSGDDPCTPPPSLMRRVNFRCINVAVQYPYVIVMYVRMSLLLELGGIYNQCN